VILYRSISGPNPLITSFPLCRCQRSNFPRSNGPIQSKSKNQRVQRYRWNRSQCNSIFYNIKTNCLSLFFDNTGIVFLFPFIAFSRCQTIFCGCASCSNTRFGRHTLSGMLRFCGCTGRLGQFLATRRPPSLQRRVSAAQSHTSRRARSARSSRHHP
jgi:hypothetical protein